MKVRIEKLTIEMIDKFVIEKIQKEIERLQLFEDLLLANYRLADMHALSF